MTVLTCGGYFVYRWPSNRLKGPLTGSFVTVIGEPIFATVGLR